MISEELSKSLHGYASDIFTEDQLTPVTQDVSDDVRVHLLALTRGHAGEDIDK